MLDLWSPACPREMRSIGSSSNRPSSGLRVKNRLIMAPMGTRLANEMGAVTDRQILYYRERARGGVGTVIVECTAVKYPLVPEHRTTSPSITTRTQGT